MKKCRFIFLVLLVYFAYGDAVICSKQEPNGIVMTMENTSMGLRVKRTDDASSQNTGEELPVEEEVPVTEEPRGSFGNKSLKPK